MWTPPFHIIKGLFALLGQFTKPDGSSYEGPIHESIDGNTYTGEAPSEDSIPLTPELELAAENDRFLEYEGEVSEIEADLVYPTPEDYKREYFLRYFLLDTRNNLVREVDLQAYERYTKELFIKGTEVKWVLEKPVKDIFSSGYLYKGAATRNRENILKASLTIPPVTEYITDYGQFADIESDIEGYKFLELPRKEQKRIIKSVRSNLQEVPLIKSKGRFKARNSKETNKENLYTPGGRYKVKSTNMDYIGFYHIHPTKGAMVGKTHSTTPHDLLIPVYSINNEQSLQETDNLNTIATPSTVSLGNAGATPSSGGSSSGGGSSSSGGGGSYY